MSTFDEGTEEVEFFEEPETLESPGRQRRRVRPRRGGPRRPAPPPGAVALARLAGLVALAIVVVVGLVFWVGSCQGKSRHDEYASYMNSVRSIAQTSSATGTTALANQFNSTKLTLPGLQTKLGEWSRQQQQAYDEALRLRPPASLQAAHQQVLATLQLRAIALAGLANSLAAAGSKSAPQEANLLAQQAQLLSASDLVWTNLFRLPASETLRRLGVKGVSAPPSHIVANPEVVSAHSFEEVYSRLKAANTGGRVTGVHGSELLGTEAVSAGQTKTLTASSPTTVDVAANLVFKVSFKNAGQYQEVKIPVTLTVNVFGKTVVNAKKVVQSIQQGGTATVSFANLNLPPSAFGANATVHVEIGKVPGESNLADNRASYPVFFSLPSNG